MKKNRVKKSKSIILIVLLILVISTVFLTNKLYIRVANLFQIERNDFSNTELNWDVKLNLKQGYNQCASYSSMALIYSQSGEYNNPKDIDKTMPFKLKNNTTYPWGIAKYLNNKNIPAMVYWHGFMTDKNREKWLKSKISLNRPVIIMTGDDNYLHFITVLGFTRNSFHIYDSLKASDTNGDYPGNVTISKKSLLESWDSAKFYNLPTNIAISI